MRDPGPILGGDRTRPGGPACGGPDRPADGAARVAGRPRLKIPTLIVSAGDPSGDRLGGALLRSLRSRGLPFEAVGLGGPSLREAGLDVAVPMESVAVMGFGDVIRHLPAIRKARATLLDLLRSRPDAIFLPIDSPGLNLGLARIAHRLDRPVVYYVLPQVWAWGYGRVRRIREDVDEMLVLFRFEEAILRREGIRGRWVGHPSGALTRDPGRGAAARRALEVQPGELLLALLPGSRRAEARRHLGPMLDAASRLVNALGPRVRVAVSDAGSVDDAIGRSETAGLWKLVSPIRVPGDAEDLVRSADLALVASGTATLECAALGVPMVIVYKTSRLNYAIARRVVRLPRIGLANIVAGADVAPELIQDEATGPRIAEVAARLLSDPATAARQREGFATLSERLGGPGSADRAADALLDFIRRRSEARAPAETG